MKVIFWWEGYFQEWIKMRDHRPPGTSSNLESDPSPSDSLGMFYLTSVACGDLVPNKCWQNLVFSNTKYLSITPLPSSCWAGLVHPCSPSWLTKPTKQRRMWQKHGPRRLDTISTVLFFNIVTRTFSIPHWQLTFLKLHWIIFCYWGFP